MFTVGDRVMWTATGDTPIEGVILRKTAPSSYCDWHIRLTRGGSSYVPVFEQELTLIEHFEEIMEFDV